MVGHQAKRVDPVPEPGYTFSDEFVQPDAILPAEEDILACVPAQDYVVDRTRDVDSRPPSHTSAVSKIPAGAEIKLLKPGTALFLEREEQGRVAAADEEQEGLARLRLGYDLLELVHRFHRLAIDLENDVAGP